MRIFMHIFRIDANLGIAIAIDTTYTMALYHPKTLFSTCCLSLFHSPSEISIFYLHWQCQAVSVWCNFICRLLLRTRPASRLHHPHATPPHLHNHDFLLLLYMIRVDSDECICVNIYGLLCILGSLFWRAGLRITLPLSVTSTSWLDMRTVISSTSFSHSGTLHLEPLQGRHRCWTTTAELMSRLC